MRKEFDVTEIPDHLHKYFVPVGGGSGVTDNRKNSHPT